MEEIRSQRGFTLMELLTVCVLIGVIAAFAIPSYMHSRRVVYEDNAIGRLRRIALAENRYYAEYGRFGDFTELRTAHFLPKGYSTRFEFSKSPISDSSILPFIDRYSLAFVLPTSINSLYYKVDAVPVGDNQMGLRTFNINMFITGDNPDNIVSVPPVREGLEIDGQIVGDY